MGSELKVSIEELKKKNVIFIDNIQQGFDNYPNFMLEGTEEYVNDAIRKLVFNNGYEDSYADFYYGKLDEESKSRVKSSLSENEIMFIESLELTTDDIFFKLDAKLLEILLKLTSNEVLFSTFYFTKYPSMVWGNYDKKYPVFFKDESVMKIVTDQIWKQGRK